MFSVLIPVFNHARYLRDAVSSALSSQLVSEVLLLDDGSKDGSRELAATIAAEADWRVRDLTATNAENRGAPCRLNELVDAARCEWVAVLNSDDVFLRRRFERIAGNKHLGQSDFVFGKVRVIDEDGSRVGRPRGPFNPGVPFPTAFPLRKMIANGSFLDLLAFQNFLITTSNMVFRKSLHAQIGGFANYRYVHDWDFALRAMTLGRPHYVDAPLTGYRVHSSNTISEDAKMVDSEAVRLFQQLLTDFPALLSRPYFVQALQPNANGVSVAAPVII